MIGQRRNERNWPGASPFTVVKQDPPRPSDRCDYYVVRLDNGDELVVGEDVLRDYTQSLSLVPYRDPKDIRAGDIIQVVNWPPSLDGQGVPVNLVNGLVYRIAYAPSGRRLGKLRRLA